MDNVGMLKGYMYFSILSGGWTSPTQNKILYV